MKYPRLVIDSEKLNKNADTILSWCHESNIDVSLVGKSICGYPDVIEPLLKRGFSMVADSRIENLNKISTDLMKMHLRIGMPSEAKNIVLSSDVSLQSDEKTILKIGEAAKELGVTHKIILMIDLGDLREGIFFLDYDLIVHIATLIINHPNLEFYGVGTNLTCYGSIVPDENNLSILCFIAEDLRKRFSADIPVVSGGNSSSLRLLRDGLMPAGVNNLRIGEAVFLGTDTSTGIKFEELYDDAFILEAEFIEVYNKPSAPIGKRSVNAFGEVKTYEGNSPMDIAKRGILAIGRQDVLPMNLIPIDDSIEILDASSDHLMVNLKKTDDIHVGDITSFKLSYGGLLSCFTSPYVEKCCSHRSDIPFNINTHD